MMIIYLSYIYRERQHLHTGDYLIILKRKNELLYDSVVIKRTESNLENLDKFNNHF